MNYKTNHSFTWKERQVGIFMRDFSLVRMVQHILIDLSVCDSSN